MLDAAESIDLDFYVSLRRFINYCFQSRAQLTMATWISLLVLGDGSQVMETEESEDRFLMV